MEKPVTRFLFLKDRSGEKERYLGGGGCKHDKDTRSEAIADKL